MATTFKKASPKPLPVQLTAKTSPVTVVPKAPPTPAQKPAKVPKEYGAEDGTTLEEPAAPTVVMKQATATVNSKFKDGSETDEKVDVGPVKAFSKPHATVGMSIALTKNLGNYESVKMSVSLFSPCDNTPEAIDNEYTIVKDWVDSKVNALNEEFSSQME